MAALVIALPFGLLAHFLDESRGRLDLDESRIRFIVGSRSRKTSLYRTTQRFSLRDEAGGLGLMESPSIPHEAWYRFSSHRFWSSSLVRFQMS